MRCLLRLGCLVLLAIIGTVAWFTRDRWLPRVIGTHAQASASRGEKWEPLSDAGAARTQAALDKLARPEGQVFESLSAADVASFALLTFGKEKARGIDSLRAMVVDDQVVVHASVAPASFSGALGMLGAVLNNAHEPLTMAGTMRVIRPGLGELTVRSVTIRDIALPQAVIPKLLADALPGKRVDGTSPNGIPVQLPLYIGDVRVANGRITLYKTVRDQK